MKNKQYSNIDSIYRDIRSISIQGATNVALATLKGIQLAMKSYKGRNLSDEVGKVGKRLSEARENEPLARNAVKFIQSVMEKEKSNDYEALKSVVLDAANQYEGLIASSKKEIVKFGTEALQKEDVVLTHCHSSTSTAILINAAKFHQINDKKFRVVSTETRPRYQGRKTAKELFDAGVDVTQIVDSACASFITEDRYLPVGAVVVGCDELLKNGSFINKVGTFSIALASQKGADEFYVATTLLKLGPESDPEKVYIEERDVSEVWDEAPKGLKIINPAFEKVDPEYVTGYITEAGVLKTGELMKKAEEMYPWMFED